MTLGSKALESGKFHNSCLEAVVVGVGRRGALINNLTSALAKGNGPQLHLVLYISLPSYLIKSHINYLL